MTGTVNGSLTRRPLSDVGLCEPESGARFSDSLRQVLAEYLDEAPRLSATARRMTVSPRTLQRLLRSEGTTWRAEVDAFRRAQASRLKQKGLSNSQVATQLGYSDARVLRRAAVRWGQAPRPDPALNPAPQDPGWPARHAS
ncbi:MAG TPA: helix-turn-helix domain-containing protein [Streptosporangiaceae bacterium]